MKINKLETQFERLVIKYREFNERYFNLKKKNKLTFDLFLGIGNKNHI